ncbi:pollen-specific leucine-rich repeat extensin-like protein 3 [Rhinatrema bivittatum]|uniref:pollen-specific leucine-rich repeat extensin-like protein 3 n=1 Tax=Rhinatrema bivittatum TaxID=194408 RepID=UPI00112802F1|nr:pollen-specific leucine-rich repeat extensin-like protein 3 [Rhinatrema bivittatum]
MCVGGQRWRRGILHPPPPTTHMHTHTHAHTATQRTLHASCLAVATACTTPSPPPPASPPPSVPVFSPPPSFLLPVSLSLPPPPNYSFPTSMLSPVLCCPLPGKARRLKQAKEEAQAEIEQYRLQREKEFHQKEQAVMGSQGNLSTEVEQQTRKKIQTMQSSHQKNKERVLRQLLTFVCDIKPEIHQNYRIM